VRDPPRISPSNQSHPHSPDPDLFAHFHHRYHTFTSIRLQRSPSVYICRRIGTRPRRSSKPEKPKNCTGVIEETAGRPGFSSVVRIRVSKFLFSSMMESDRVSNRHFLCSRKPRRYQMMQNQKHVQTADGSVTGPCRSPLRVRWASSFHHGFRDISAGLCVRTACTLLVYYIIQICSPEVNTTGASYATNQFRNKDVRLPNRVADSWRSRLKRLLMRQII